MNDTLKLFVRNRAGGSCEYCGIHSERMLFDRFQIDHIRAKQHGGDDVPANLAYAWLFCNL